MKKEHAKKVKMSKSDIVFQGVTYAVFSLLIVVFAYPFYYLLISTISDNQMVDMNKVFLYPIGINFRNYIEVFKLDKMRSAALVSVARTVLGTSLSVVATSYMAYFFTKDDMWHKKLWYRLVVSTMYFSAGLIPAYLNIKMLGLLNTFWIYVLPGCLGAYNLILVKTFMESLPGSLEESAEIDGAGYLTRFIRIVLPLSKPILATIALFCAVSHWNSMFDTKLYISDTKLYTLQFVLYEYQQQVKSIQEYLVGMGMEDANMASASSTTALRLTMTAVTVAPIMCVYPFIQKYYMKGMMLGAVKG